MTLSHTDKLISESCYIKPNLDYNYNFPMDLAPNLQEHVQLQSKFSLIVKDLERDLSGRKNFRKSLGDLILFRRAYILDQNKYDGEGFKMSLQFDP